MDPFILFNLLPNQMAKFTDIAPPAPPPTTSKSIYSQRLIETAAFLRTLQDHTSPHHPEDPDERTSRLYTFGSDLTDARRDAVIRFNDSIAWLLSHAPGMPVAASLIIEPPSSSPPPAGEYAYTPSTDGTQQHKLTLLTGHPEPHYFKQNQWGPVFHTIISYVRDLSASSIPRAEAHEMILRHVIQMKTQKLARYSNKIWIPAGTIGVDELGYVRDWIDTFLHALQAGHDTGDFTDAARSLSANPDPPEKSDGGSGSDEDWNCLRRNIRKMALPLEVARNLVNFAEVCPDIFANAEYGGEMDMDFTIHTRVEASEADFTNSLSRVLRRITSDDEKADLLKISLLEDVPEFNNYETLCQDLWQHSRAHAEVQLLQYLADKPDIKPLYGYVGTGKAACVCCKRMLEKRGLQCRGERKVVRPDWISSRGMLRDEGSIRAWVGDVRGVRRDLEREIRRELEGIVGDLPEIKEAEATVDRQEEEDLELLIRDVQSGSG